MTNAKGETRPGTDRRGSRDGDFTNLLKIKKSCEALLKRLREEYPDGSPK